MNESMNEPISKWRMKDMFSHEKCKGKEYYLKTPHIRHVLFEKRIEMFLKFQKILKISLNGLRI